MQALSDHLRMGIAANAQELPAHVLYQEAIGAQIAWVAARDPQITASPVQLELLYKALSMNKETVLKALAAAPIAPATSSSVGVAP